MKLLTSLLLTGVAATAWSVSAAEADDHAKWDLSKLDAGKLPPVAAAKGLTYAKDIKPMLEASCFNCHGEQRQRGELRLDSLEALLKGGEGGKIVEPGASAKSKMIFAAAQVNDDIAMPPKRPPGGRGGFQPPPELVKRFDKDGDGKLSDAESQAMRAEFQAQRGGGQGGQPGNRPPGAGGPPQGGTGGPQGQGGPGGPGGGRGGPPAKPLTAEQVGVLRAWIDQGAK